MKLVYAGFCLFRTRAFEWDLRLGLVWVPSLPVFMLVYISIKRVMFGVLVWPQGCHMVG